MHDTFLKPLLFEGRLIVQAEPEFRFSAGERAVAEEALAIARASLPGPQLEGDLGVFEAATKLTYRIAHGFLHREDASARSPESLRMPHAPRGAWGHFSADLVLRFLPGIVSRIKSRDPRDPLVKAGQAVLRQWPLSGVLADLTEPPEAPLDFGGHPGLAWLYGQRLAQRERPAWIPDGPLRDDVSLAYDALGRTLPAALPSRPE
jgi:hypothetical protein